MLISGYRLLAKVASGGFSEVWRAEETGSGRVVIIKLLGDPNDPRAEREIDALRVVGSPLAPALLDTGRTSDGRRYLCLEEVCGRAMANFVRPARLAAVIPFLRAAAAAIDAIGAAGIIHRDIKPEHIIARDGGGVSVIDFGIAIAAASAERGAGAADLQVTRAGGRVGTLCYMAPEQLTESSLRLTSALDRYAFAVAAFELLAGQPPFLGSANEVRHQHLMSRPPRLSALVAGEEALDAVFSRALAKVPSARYPSAAEFVANLGRAETDKSPKARARAEAVDHEMALVAFTPHGALAAIESALAGSATLAVLERDLAIVAVPGAQNREVGLRIALVLWRRLSTEGRAGSSATLHVARLLARERGGRVVVRGEALTDRSWVSGRDGIWLSDAAGAAFPAAEQIEDSGRLRLMARADLAARGDPTLRGRERETEVITAALGDAPCIVTIEGDSGLGKSRIAKWASEAAAEQFAAVWFIDARAAAERSGTLSARLSEMSERLAPAPPTRDPRDDNASLAGRLRAAEALAQALRRVADQGGLALIVDDAHLADSIALDALELATMAGIDARLWIAVTASPALRQLRPTWGARLTATRGFTLKPLPDVEAAALVRELLLPAEYVPEQAVMTLVKRAAGVPLFLVELVRGLHSAGLVVPNKAGDSAVLSSEGISFASIVGRGLGFSGLAGLPAGVRRFAELCAVVEGPLEASWLNVVASDLGGISIDASVGLAWLAGEGVLSADKERYRFRHPPLLEAIASGLAPLERTRMHRAVLSRLDPSDASNLGLERRSRHAEGAGENAAASASYRQLAAAHMADHAVAAAEAAFGAALRLESDPRARMALLRGRAEARTKVPRLALALADAKDAAHLADEIGDRAGAFEIALLEATILDWMYDRSAAACAVERAENLLERFALAPSSQLWLARGRVAFRDEDPARAVSQLEKAAELANAAADFETEIGARALLAVALLFADRIEDSERCFMISLERARTAGDLFHEAALLCNLSVLALRQDRRDQAEQALEGAILLARRLGNVQLEWSSLHNLAELRHFRGLAEEALPLAERAMLLQTRYENGPEFADNAVLVARIAAALGDVERAATEIAGVRLRCQDGQIGPTAGTFARALELLASSASQEAWIALEAAPDATLLSVDYRLEFFALALAAARQRGDDSGIEWWTARAAPLLAEAPLWRQRF